MTGHVCNNTILIVMKVSPVQNKMLERRLRWYGQLRREENLVTKIVTRVDIAGERPRRRPKMRWINAIKGDLNEFGILAEDTLDRNK